MDTNIKERPPKPTMRYHLLLNCWTIQGSGVRVCAGSMEGTYEVWKRGVAEDDKRKSSLKKRLDAVKSF